MKILKTIYYLSFAFLLVSCQDVIELDVPEGKTRLAVEGLLTDQEGLQTIKLTYTTPYFSKEQPKRVSGASVVITDDLGEAVVMEETSPGIYQKEFSGVVGRSYKLSIVTAEGIKYTSLEERMEPVAPIAHFDYEFEEKSPTMGLEKDGYYAFLILDDPAGRVDYYRWRFFLNGEMKDKAEDLYFVTDRVLDGVEGLFLNFTRYPLENQDHVKIEQMSITENAYNFLKLLERQTASVGSQFDTPPAPIKGNIFNANDSDDYAVGYFMVSAVATEEFTIEIAD